MSLITLQNALDNEENLSVAFKNKLLPSGGTTGQFLKKTGSDDYVRNWSTILVADIDDLSSDQIRTITAGTTDPTGGSNGDIYMQYED